MRTLPDALVKQLDAYRTRLLNVGKTQATANLDKIAAEGAQKKAEESERVANEAYDASSASGSELIDAINAWMSGTEPKPEEPEPESPPTPAPSGFPSLGSQRPGSVRR